MPETPAANEQLRYPVGRHAMPGSVSQTDARAFARTIERFPREVRGLVESATDHELEQRYRPGGWTALQVVHHCADSHLNAFTRFKLALSEDNPTIKPYREALWAEQADYATPVKLSLLLLDGLHARWAALLEGLDEVQWERRYVHPGRGESLSLAQTAGLYDWHCRHHLGHLKLIFD